MTHKKTIISSIFGQIEKVIGDAMIAEKKVKMIPVEDIPISVRYNDKDRIAYYALIFSPEAEREFNKRVSDLRA